MVGAPVFRQAQLSDLDALVRNNIAMAVVRLVATLAGVRARTHKAALHLLNHCRLVPAWAQDSEGVTLAPDTARGGVAAVLNDPTCSKGKYFVLEVRTAGHMGRCSSRDSCAAIAAEQAPLTQLDGDAVAQLFITYEWSDWCAAVGLPARVCACCRARNSGA